MEEIKELLDVFKKLPYPDWLIKLVLENKVIGHEFYLDESLDESELGVSMQWLSPKDQKEEACDYYPGIEAIKFNYLPVGCCLEGSGDPYFINTEETVPRLYRIPHDIDFGEDKFIESIEYVCLLEDLFKSQIG